ncbi:uncharacterized protein LOC114124271 isoform X2 [Aphis gossypii]|uniref:uncharacterized protein LOC114124271 isoform X2 n=1 Tax=Aphis gossypii TaxID=80765 RepID=UPI002158C65E|nr:uncharacterized protein LOC114124271 isoform X2 [Aphis gossypii]
MTHVDIYVRILVNVDVHNMALVNVDIDLRTADFIKKNGYGGVIKKYGYTRKAIKNAINTDGCIYRNWKKIIGFAPIVKDLNDIHKLLDLVLNEADLIKIGAFRKLNMLPFSALNEEGKKDLISAKIQATTELIKYSSVKLNWPKVNIIFQQGLFYAYWCGKIFKDSPGECFKRKTQLLETFIFRHKFEINRGMRRWLVKTSKEAENYLENDKTLQFINTKIACKIKLLQENKPILIKLAMKLCMGGTKKNKAFNCVTELKPFEKHLKEVGSYTGEYHYLLAKAYAHQDDDLSALEHLRIALEAHVLDTKTRNINKKVQHYYEKIYIRAYDKYKQLLKL